MSANLKSDEKLSKVIVNTTGRIDIGHKYIQKMKDANVPMMEDVEIIVSNGGLFGAVVSAWGEMSAVYVVKKV